MEENNSLKKEGPLAKQPLLIFIWAVLPIISVFGISLASSTPDTEDLFANRSLIAMSFLQIVSVAIMLVLPALLISYIYKKKVFQFLNMLNLPSFQMVLLVLALMFSANFFINYLVELNHLIPLSPGLTIKFGTLHDNALATQAYFLNFEGALEFFLVFLTMAIVPALAEEMYFRGLVEGVLIDMKVGAVHAILISSILFAMMHFQFYYLLPLLFMGAILGYVYYRTRNLWLSILMHFMNNAIIVVMALRNKISTTPIDLDANPPIYISIIGLIIFAFFLFIFHKKTIKH